MLCEESKSLFPSPLELTFCALQIRLQAKSGSSSHEKSDGIVDDAGHHGSVMDKAKEGTTGLAKAGSSPNQEPNTNDGSVVVKECKTSSVLAIHDDAERHEGSVVDAERHKGSVVDAERHEGSVMAKAKEATSGLVSLYNGVGEKSQRHTRNKCLVEFTMSPTSFLAEQSTWLTGGSRESWMLTLSVFLA